MPRMTTAGIVATLVATGAGVTASIISAIQTAENCASKALTFTASIDTSFTTPSFQFDINTSLPEITVPVKVYGVTVPLTIPPGTEVSFPLELPGMAFKISSFVANNTLQQINSAPDDVAKLCFNLTLQTYLAYTVIGAGLLALATYACHIHGNQRRQRNDVEKGAQPQASADKKNATELKPLPSTTTTTTAGKQAEVSAAQPRARRSRRRG